MLKIIKDTNGKTLAYVRKENWDFEGVNFFTPDEAEFQIGCMKHPKGHHVKAHCHKDRKKLEVGTSEMIFVKEGKIKVILYDNEKKKFEEIILESGDLILCVSGGHAVDILEDAKMIEIKQGPYLGIEKDKEFFE